MHRLHVGLKNANVDSKILCKAKTPDFADSVAIPPSRPMQRLAESLVSRITVPFGLQDIHCLSSFNIKDSQAYRDADILNFHGLQGGFFNYLALPSLTADKPGVLTLHDMWPFTGHCSISYDCERWRTGCGHCPYLDVSPPVERDATRIEWKLKNWAYKRSKLAVITLSTCRTEQVKQSMLNRFPIHQIPNGIDTKTYQPLDGEHCRSLLGLPPKKYVLLFASAKLHQFNKGGDLLVKALQKFPGTLKRETVLLTLGHHGEALADAVDMQTVNLGYVGSDRLKAIIYSAADLFVLPTRAESLPLVLQESMACGTPLVSFRVGGVPDVVRPGITGYLAEPEDAQDFRSGIVQLLEDSSLRAWMGQQCRAIAVKEYALELQVQRYIALYQQLLNP
jgi:glycosyltransferase involved in cell wall biosynthesis